MAELPLVGIDLRLAGTEARFRQGQTIAAEESAAGRASVPTDGGRREGCVGHDKSAANAVTLSAGGRTGAPGISVTPSGAGASRHCRNYTSRSVFQKLTRYGPTAAAVLATWPVWQWYVRRTFDGSDEPWGLVALVLFAALSVREPGRRSRLDLRWPALWLAVYAVSVPWAPPLLRAIFAVSAIAALLLRPGASAGLRGLLLLSLPLVATLQFYLGYPLRLLAAGLTAQTLPLLGYDVARAGVNLRWAGETVMVDAPCSGVQMLWCSLVVACAASAFYRLPLVRTGVALLAAVVLAVLANSSRATVLFFKEAHVVAWPEWTHPAVGLVIFAATMWPLLLLLRHFHGSRPRVETGAAAAS